MDPLCYARILQRLVAIVCRLVRDGGKSIGFHLSLSEESQKAVEALSHALEQHAEGIDKDEDDDYIEDILEEDDSDDEGDDLEQDESEEDEDGDGSISNSDRDSNQDERQQVDPLGSCAWVKKLDRDLNGGQERAGSRKTEDTSSEKRDGVADCVEKLHRFLVELLLLPVVKRNGSPAARHNVPPWDLPIERLLAVYCLEGRSDDGFNFTPAEKLTQLFAALHYFIRGAILYQATSEFQYNNLEDCEMYVETVTAVCSRC